MYRFNNKSLFLSNQKWLRHRIVCEAMSPMIEGVISKPNVVCVFLCRTASQSVNWNVWAILPRMNAGAFDFGCRVNRIYILTQLWFRILILNILNSGDNTTKPCSILKYTCYEEAEMKFISQQCCDCDCLPECVSLEYAVDMSKLRIVIESRYAWDPCHGLTFVIIQLKFLILVTKMIYGKIRSQRVKFIYRSSNTILLHSTVQKLHQYPILLQAVAVYWDCLWEFHCLVSSKKSSILHFGCAANQNSDEFNPIHIILTHK